MKKITLILLSIVCSSFLFAQDPPEPLDAFSVMGVPRAANVAELNAINSPTPNIGSVAYNNANGKLYVYSSSGWVMSDEDDQFDDEVLLRTPIDVNNIPTDPSPVNEVNLQQVIEAIAPITSRNGRVFYPPSIQIDASTNGTFTRNLYQEYVNQYSGAGIIRSEIAGTPAPDIPVYAVDELYYYVTFADPAVFSNISIDGTTGIMTYTIVGQPVDFNSLINVVFVVK